MAKFEEKKLPANASAGARLYHWIDARLPIGEALRKHMTEYYAPKNFNYWYAFGSLAMLVLVLQIVTGIFLVMHYKPDAQLAFASVEYIMREVPAGWWIRYMHSTGASAFFIVVYLHMARAFLYGSYRKPRELLWIFGVAIFLALMAEAFMGYLLPWGQMSYWGAQVIVNLFQAIPVIGPDLSLWIRGDYVVSDATLNRFFSLHVIAIPLALVGLVFVHILALHQVGSNNPDGIEIKEKTDEKGIPLDGIPFHPFYTVHDAFVAAVFFLVFMAVVFFMPEFGGYFLEYNNFIPADPLVTPLHIAPVWYFTPFYSVLRATTGTFMWVLSIAVIAFAVFLWRQNLSKKASTILAAFVLVLLVGFFNLDPKFWGVVLMGAAVVILGAMPWLDRSPVKSMRYRPRWHTGILLVFVIAFIALGYLGIKPPSPVFEKISQLCTLLYFAFFALMPWWSKAGQFKPEPQRVNFTAH